MLCQRADQLSPTGRHRRMRDDMCIWVGVVPIQSVRREKGRHVGLAVQNRRRCSFEPVKCAVACACALEGYLLFCWFLAGRHTDLAPWRRWAGDERHPRGMAREGFSPCLGRQPPGALRSPCR